MKKTTTTKSPKNTTTKKKTPARTLGSRQKFSFGQLSVVAGLMIVVGITLVWRIYAATPATAPATTAAATPNPSASVFTLASIPDTQWELWDPTKVANNFRGRLNWLVANRGALNLQYVWQVGDLQDTDNLIFSSNKAVNPRYISDPDFTTDHWQYEQASKALADIFDANKMPYILTIGNHDTGAVCGGPACPVVAGQTQATTIEVRNTKTWNKYYPLARYGMHATQGLAEASTDGRYEPGKSDNAYRTFTAGGLKWLVMNYELWPRTGVVSWMKQVVAAHPHHNVILISHSHLNGAGGIEQTNGGYGANSPQYVYDNLIKQYPNIKFTFSGHVGNSDYRVDTGVKGNKIYSFMDCYHDPNNNWIRLLTLDTANNTIKTKVYAPLTKATRSEATANVNITGVTWTR